VKNKKPSQYTEAQINAIEKGNLRAASYADAVHSCARALWTAKNGFNFKTPQEMKKLIESISMSLTQTSKEMNTGIHVSRRSIGFVGRINSTDGYRIADDVKEKFEGMTFEEAQTALTKLLEKRSPEWDGNLDEVNFIYLDVPPSEFANGDFNWR